MTSGPCFLSLTFIDRTLVREEKLGVPTGLGPWWTC